MGRALITGVDGFMASHLTDYILDHEPDWEIYGTCRRLADKKNIIHRLKHIHLLVGLNTDDTRNNWKKLFTICP